MIGPAQRTGAVLNWWKPNAFTTTSAPQQFGVFFPSLSHSILWKGGAVSRVRCAAQKPRALDTAPPFQNKNRLSRKRREGVANRNQRESTTVDAGGCKTGMASGDFTSRPKLKPKTPSGINLLPPQNGLDNGVHFKVPAER